MKKTHLAIANALFAFHLFIIGLILFGWLAPAYKVEYLALILMWLACWILLGYCPLTKWEFLLRGKYEKGLDPKAEFIQHYAYKFLRLRIPLFLIFVVEIVVCMILIRLSVSAR